jgi:predicted nucleic acid-binding protein
MNNLFIDTNVFLDAILKRSENWQDCKSIFDLSYQKAFKLKTTSSVLLTVIYFIQKSGFSTSAVVQIADELLKIVNILPTNESVFFKAMQADFNDLEDAVQYYSAIESKSIDFFITSNTKDFKKSAIELPVVNPKQFLKLFNRN